MPAIEEICRELSAIDMPKPVTLVTLSASPGAYIPMLASITRKYERQYQLQQRLAQESQDLPRLFSLCPVPSLKWRFITVNPNALSSFSGIKMPTTYEAKLEMFNKVFDFKRLRLDSFQDLPDPNK
ncbi:hypothetical protein K7432_005821 [Basidiobolus ranarum]|uniref:Uncharacterized protein n=1 Tax=Basidiobolus ranarum TaxID=34480 RepID=A0ABR2W2K0_9FUNG